METSRAWFNPIEWLAARGVETAHITFDPDVVPEYRIIRQTTHDGTALFSEEMEADAIAPLANRTSYYVPKGPPPSRAAVRYVVGRARVAVVYGKVDLPVGRYPGQRERITIPVRTEYVAVR